MNLILGSRFEEIGLKPPMNSKTKETVSLEDRTLTRGNQLRERKTQPPKNVEQELK
jgi:hypothetical protein